MPRCRKSATVRGLSEAESLCQRRGVRLTEQRRRVLAIVYRSPRPLGAYDILDAIRADVPRVAPPTVYRALDFLLGQGLIHKLETIHAYIGCENPTHPSVSIRISQFLICKACGDVTELEDHAISESLRRAAAASAFSPAQGVVEVSGTCAQCAAAVTDS